MKKYRSNLINAISLVVLGLWGYLASPTPSPTALIPVIAGIILAALHKGVSNEKKIEAHVAVVVTFVVLLGLVKPLMGAIERNQPEAIARVVVMMLTSVLSLTCFVKSFVDARKGR